jgi:hypothetical protein
MGKARNAYKMAVRKPEEKGPLLITGCSWEDDINMDVRGMEEKM